MLNLISLALAWLWVVCILVRGGGVPTAQPAHNHRTPMPRGLHWQSIKPLPGRRVVAWRIQVIVA